jgi:hypothetical protein
LSLAIGVPLHEIYEWPAWEIATYMEYDSIEPFGDFRANWHSALIAYILAKVNTPTNKRQPELKDFIWRDETTRREESTAHVFAMMRALKKDG